jgi:hypothetical protein
MTIRLLVFFINLQHNFIRDYSKECLTFLFFFFLMASVLNLIKELKYFQQHPYNLFQQG